MNNTTNNSKTNNTEIGNNINRSSQLNANNDQDSNLKSHSIYRRFLPGLLMLLLGVAFATTGVVSEVSAQSPLDQWLSYMPANGGQQSDTNGDGVVDVIYYDTNGDGLVEAARMDTNLNGYLNVVALDKDRNGVFDEYIDDTNRDGVLETAYVDNNQDGHLDRVGYDLNGTGYYSGWTYLSPPAQQQQSQLPSHWQGPDVFGWDILAILGMGIDVPRGTGGMTGGPQLGDIMSRLGNAQSNLGGLTPQGYDQVQNPLTGTTGLQRYGDMTPQY